MNDWEIKKFLKVVLAIQFAMWGVIGLDAMGLGIPILREFVGFIYLTLIPGIVILRILKLHKLSMIETLLYSVGLSIATLMFTGLFMNTIYPFFGISEPISFIPLVITISMVVLVLCILSYMRDKDFSNLNFIDIKDVLSPPTLFLCLVPFLSIFGTYLVNFHHNNILLMLLILVIAGIAGLVGFNRIIPKRLYPLAVFVIAISLIYHRSLISMYLIGTDIQGEYYCCKMVALNRHWDPAIGSSFNAMLIVTILPTIYSFMLNMDGLWLFKAFYPFIFSFVPLGLYQAYRRQMDEKVAFLSVFFFVSFFVFYSDMIWLTKQQIAEFFFMLFILLTANEKIDLPKRRLLFIVFGASMVVSHYGTSYIFMFILIFAFAILHLMKSKSKVLTQGSVLIFVIMALLWYIYVEDAIIFKSIVHIGEHIYSSIFAEFLNPETAEGLNYLLVKPTSPLHHIDKSLHFLTQFFITIGLIQMILKRKKTKFCLEYLSFSIVSFGICLMSIILPYFSRSMGTTRLYHVMLISLAPFCVIGGGTVFRIVLERAKLISQHYILDTKVFVAIILILFLMFNTGFIYEVTKDGPNSPALSQERLRKGNAKTRAGFYNNYIRKLDVVGARWLSKNMDYKSKIYVGRAHPNRIPLTAYTMVNHSLIYTLPHDYSRIGDGSYIYLGSLNIVDNIMVYGYEEMRSRLILHNTSEVYPFVMSKYKIYSNGGSEVYYLGGYN